MKVKQLLITPDQALTILANNTNNRPLSVPHVNRLAKEMKDGHWKPNGDAIRMNGDSLIDGQHRLHACVESEVPFETILVTDLAADTFDTIDIGKRRSHSDTLAVKGEKYTTMLASALLMINSYEKKEYGGRYTTNIQLQEMLDKHPEVRHSVELIQRSRRMFIPGAILAACHYLFSRGDPFMANKFIGQVISGHGLWKGDPPLTLRDRMLQLTQGSKSQPNRFQTLAYIIKAWNAAVTGKSIHILRWRSGVNTAEEFPRIK
jgi:hypothetical protein